jgi:hypothetical protein
MAEFPGTLPHFIVNFTVNLCEYQFTTQSVSNSQFSLPLLKRSFPKFFPQNLQSLAS